MIALINLIIVHPVPPILQLSVLYQLPVSMAKIVLEISSIDESISIVNLSETTFFVIVILTPVFDIGLPLSKVSLAMAKAVAKISLIIVTIWPVVFAFTIWPILWVVAYIGLPVLEPFGTHPMLEWIFELSLVSAAIFHDKYPKTLYSILLPLSYVAFTVSTGPHATPSFSPAVPLPIIDLSIAPLEHSPSMSNSFPEFPFEIWTIRIVFVPDSILEIVF